MNVYQIVFSIFFLLENGLGMLSYDLKNSNNDVYFQTNIVYLNILVKRKGYFYIQCDLRNI